MQSNHPIERHRHTLVIDRMVNGEVRLVEDRYRVDRTIRQDEITAIKTAFEQRRGPAEIARLVQSIRDTAGRSPHTPSWAQLARDISGHQDGAEHQFWWNRLLFAAGCAHVAGEPVTLMPNSVYYAEKYLGRLSADERAWAWDEMIRAQDNATLVATWRRLIANKPNAR